MPQELVDQELEALRQTVAELVPADDRPARAGDTLVVDLQSPGGRGAVGHGRRARVGTARRGDRDGAGRRAASARRRRSPTSSPTTRLPAVTITVKHVNEKVLPEIDDELARSASEFDTLAELRADIEGRVRVAVDEEIDAAFRAAAVDALVTASNVQGAGPLVETRARELLDGFVRSLGRRGIAPDDLFPGHRPVARGARRLRCTRRPLIGRARAGARGGGRQGGIEISDDEVKALIREQAEEAGDDPEQVIEDVWSHGHRSRCEKTFDSQARSTVSPPTSPRSRPNSQRHATSFGRLRLPARPPSGAARFPRRGPAPGRSCAGRRPYRRPRR